MTRINLKSGDRVEVILPHSEVCMHMRVAGKRAIVEVVTNGLNYTSAQIRRQDGTPFSAAVTLGEAGLYEDREGVYTYPIPADDNSPWIS
jgi:hypothetical protein